MFSSAYLKFYSYIYLLFLTILLLIPLDSFIILSIIREENHPTNFSSFIIHFFLFFILYSLFKISFYKNEFILIFCFFYSIIIESLQIFSSRGFQLFDIIFNLIGVFTSYFFLRKFFNK